MTVNKHPNRSRIRKWEIGRLGGESNSELIYPDIRHSIASIDLPSLNRIEATDTQLNRLGPPTQIRQRALSPVTDPLRQFPSRAARH